MNSSEGPCLCSADFNQDGLDDLYIGSAKNQVSKIYYQTTEEIFRNTLNRLKKICHRKMLIV